MNDERIENRSVVIKLTLASIVCIGVLGAMWQSQSYSIELKAGLSSVVWIAFAIGALSLHYKERKQSTWDYE